MCRIPNALGLSALQGGAIPSGTGSRGGSGHAVSAQGMAASGRGGYGGPAGDSRWTDPPGMADIGG